MAQQLKLDSENGHVQYTLKPGHLIQHVIPREFVVINLKSSLLVWIQT
jgi:hypothetical protein